MLTRANSDQQTHLHYLQRVFCLCRTPRGHGTAASPACTRMSTGLYAHLQPLQTASTASRYSKTPREHLVRSVRLLIDLLNHTGVHRGLMAPLRRKGGQHCSRLHAMTHAGSIRSTSARTRRSWPGGWSSSLPSASWCCPRLRCMMSASKLWCVYKTCSANLEAAISAIVSHRVVCKLLSACP